MLQKKMLLLPFTEKKASIRVRKKKILGEGKNSRNIKICTRKHFFIRPNGHLPVLIRPLADFFFSFPNIRKIFVIVK